MGFCFFLYVNAIYLCTEQLFWLIQSLVSFKTNPDRLCSVGTSHKWLQCLNAELGSFYQLKKLNLNNKEQSDKSFYVCFPGNLTMWVAQWCDGKITPVFDDLVTFVSVTCLLSYWSGITSSTCQNLTKCLQVKKVDPQFIIRSTCGYLNGAFN